MDLKQILNSKNVVELLEDDHREKISSNVLEQFNTDKQSREEKQRKLGDIIKLALSISEDKSFPWPNASNTVFPLISTAIVDFGAKCSPEILRDDFIVKPKVIGKDDGKPMFNVDGSSRINEQTGQPVLKGVNEKRERGERVATYMNYQLSEEIEDWQENTDKLLVSLAATGMMFRKTYEGENKKIISELIYPDKLILHDKTTKFNRAPITHIIELYKNEIQEKIRRGYFIDFEYEDDSSESISSVLTADLSDSQDNSMGESTNTGLYIFLEQCCWLDLDKDGFVEPYVVTIHQRSNTVVRIAARFTEKDIKREGKKVVSIEAHNPYTPYSFLPSPDGSFYAIGLGHLLYNLNKSANSSINQITDAGTLQTTGGGFIAKSLKIRGGAFKMRPHEYKMVDSYGSSIRDSIVSLPTPEPSKTLFAMLGFLIQSGKELGSLRDVLNGENAANVQATTMMALVEQGITQFKSIYKRIYRSLKSEFKLIYNIDSKVLTNQKYAEVIDEPTIDVNVKGDFSGKGFDIVPVADVSSITNTQRMAKANFLMQFMGDPYTDQLLLRQRVLNAFNVENYQDLIVAPPPAEPDANSILAQAEMAKAENRLKEIQIQSVEASANLEKSKYDIEKTVAEIEKIKSDVIKNISDAFSKEKETQLKSILTTAESIRKDIELRAGRQPTEKVKQNEVNANEETNRSDNRIIS